MTTVLLWHLGITGVLLVAVTLLVAVQGLLTRVRAALAREAVQPYPSVPAPRAASEVAQPA